MILQVVNFIDRLLFFDSVLTQSEPLESVHVLLGGELLLGAVNVSDDPLVENVERNVRVESVVDHSRGREPGSPVKQVEVHFFFQLEPRFLEEKENSTLR